MPVTASRDLLALVPDGAQTIAPRGLLLSGEGRVLVSAPSRDALIVASADRTLVSVVGSISPAEIAQARALASPGASWLLVDENARLRAHLADALPGHVPTHHTLFACPPGRLASLRADAGADVRWVMTAGATDLSALDPPLRDELDRACRRSVVAGAFDEGVLVAFCLAAFETETLWLATVHTAPRARRRGHGAAVARFVAAHQRTLGKAPVGVVPADDHDGHAFAARLGLVATGSVTVFRAVRR